MSVSFYGTEQTVLTFEAGTAVTPSYPVGMSHNNQVNDAAAGTAPVGIALHVRQGYVTVQTRGFVELPYSGTAPSLGWQSLVTDGTGGLKSAGSTELGRACLVIAVDSTKKTIGLYL